MFIARVSKGRTIKEFVAGVLFAPTLVNIIFFAIFGSSALHIEKNGIAKLSELITETVTFGMYEHYPFGSILSMITILVIAIFFITSADSATLDRKSTRLNSSHVAISYAVFCLKKK